MFRVQYLADARVSAATGLRSLNRLWLNVNGKPVWHVVAEKIAPAFRNDDSNVLVRIVPVTS